MSKEKEEWEEKEEKKEGHCQPNQETSMFLGWVVRWGYKGENNVRAATLHKVPTYKGQLLCACPVPVPYHNPQVLALMKNDMHEDTLQRSRRCHLRGSTLLIFCLKLWKIKKRATDLGLGLIQACVPKNCLQI